MRLSEVCARIGVEVIRDSEFESLGLLCHVSPRMLVCLYDPSFIQRELLTNSSIAAVITSTERAPLIPGSLGLGTAPDPVEAFYALHEILVREGGFYWQDFETEISPEAVVHGGAQVAGTNVKIGPGTVVEPNAVILERCLIGRDCRIRSGVVLGAEGFEPKRLGGKFRIVPHAGGVMIGDGVEIQSNSVVCRSVFNSLTQIGDEAKISSLVNISHNVSIGKRCRIGSSAAVLGSATIGDEVWIGPNATISNRVSVGDGAAVSLGSVVVRDVPAGARVSGNFAIDHKRFLSLFRSSLK
jgi:UDP-3-O-[3-hydroxymyristoyl] glucosamine N-acyltransferase